MKEITINSEADLQIISNVCKMMLLKNPKLTVTVKKFTESLRDKQRAIYFLWAGIIANDLGNEKHEQHWYLKERFLLPIYLASDNETHRILQRGWEHLQIVKRDRPELHETLYQSILSSVSIMDANVDEGREYLTVIDRWASSELNIRLPRDDDRYYAAMGLTSRRGNDRK